MRKLRGHITLDLETTTTVHMKRKASPFTQENWVVAAGWLPKDTLGLKDGEVGGDYYGADKQAFRGWFKWLLETYNPARLVGFNIKFDLQHMIVGAADYEAYQQWIVDGGELWDTQLVEHKLDGMTEDSQMLSLDEVAIRYGGELKIDEVKAYWAKGVNTHHIPQQLLMDYLMGRAMPDDTVRPGDVQNTEMIYQGQLATVLKRGNLQAMRLENGALVAVTEMERNGLFVDREVARIEMIYLNKEIEDGERELAQYYPKDLPFTLNWNSVVHKSAIFFGGRIPYTQRVPVLDLATGEQEYVQKEETHYLVDGGTVPQQEYDDWVSYGKPGQQFPDLLLNKSGKQAGQPKTRKVKVDDHSKPKFRNEEFHYELPGYIKPKPQWKSKAYDNVYSTSKEVMEQLEDSDVPFIKAFTHLSKMKKDLSTYYQVDVYEEGADEEGNAVQVLKKSTGMLTLLQDDGLVHHTINQTSTVTGRFSHNNPNSGNLPREGTSRVKAMFTSRFPDGKIISSDFRSLEVYCQAILTGDRQLIADLQADIDMHCMRLSVVENKPYEEVLVLAKGNRKLKIDPILEWERKRTDIKTYSFQRAYGAGAGTIAAKVKKPKEVVEEWIKADDLRYSGIPTYNEKLARAVAAKSVPSKVTITHPTARIPLHLNIGYHTTFDGTRYSWMESAAPDFLVRKGIYQSFKPTELKNYPVQGLGAQWMKAAMWLAVKAFYRYRNFGGLGLLNNTVHDAVYADAHPTVARKVGLVVHASMLAASDLIEYLFGKDIAVPVPSETTYGPSQFVQEDYPEFPLFIEQSEKVRTWMRQEFMDGYTPSFLKE